MYRGDCMGKPRSLPVRGFIRLSILAVLAGAAAVGAILALGIPPSHDRLFDAANVYLSASPISLVIERALRYMLPIGAVYFLAFIPAAAVLSYALLFIRVTALSFTAVVLALNGRGGWLGAAVLLGPQNLIWLPVFMSVMSASLCQAAAGARARLIIGGAKSKNLAFRLKIHAGKEYASPLLMGLLASLSAAVIETWLTPALYRLTI